MHFMYFIYNRVEYNNIDDSRVFSDIEGVEEIMRAVIPTFQLSLSKPKMMTGNTSPFVERGMK